MTPQDVAPVGAAADMLRRLPWADAIELDDELLVLLERRGPCGSTT